MITRNVAKNAARILTREVLRRSFPNTYFAARMIKRYTRGRKERKEEAAAVKKAPLSTNNRVGKVRSTNNTGNSEYKKDVAELKNSIGHAVSILKENNALIKAQIGLQSKSITYLVKIADLLSQQNADKNKTNIPNPTPRKGANLTPRKAPAVKNPLTGRFEKAPVDTKTPITGVKPPTTGGIASKVFSKTGAFLNVLGAGIDATNEYQESGSVGRAASVGGGSFAGGVAGAMAGGTAGLALGPIGGIVGALIGGYVGSEAGSYLGRSVYDIATGERVSSSNDNPKKLVPTEESKAVVDARKVEQKSDILKFEANQIKFMSKKLKFDVDRLTINSDGTGGGLFGQSGGSQDGSSGSNSGGSTGQGSGGGTNSSTGGGTPGSSPAKEIFNTQTGKFEKTTNTPVMTDAAGNKSGGENVVSSGFVPNKTTAAEALTKAGKFSPSSEFIGSLNGKLGGSFKEQAPEVMNRLMKDFNLSKEQAAGIVGNLGHESIGLKAGIQEGGKDPNSSSRGGLGWAQWTGSRRREFERYAQDKGLKTNDPEANYGFLKHELQTKYKNSITDIKKQTTASGAMMSFENTFEKAGIKHYPSRENYTNKALDAFNTAPKLETKKSKKVDLPAGSALFGDNIPGMNVKVLRKPEMNTSKDNRNKPIPEEVIKSLPQPPQPEFLSHELTPVENLNNQKSFIQQRNDENNEISNQLMQKPVTSSEQIKPYSPPMQAPQYQYTQPGGNPSSPKMGGEIQPEKKSEKPGQIVDGASFKKYFGYLDKKPTMHNTAIA